MHDRKVCRLDKCDYPFLSRSDSTQKVMILDKITGVTVIIMVIIRIHWYSLRRLKDLSVRQKMIFYIFQRKKFSSHAGIKFLPVEIYCWYISKFPDHFTLNVLAVSIYLSYILQQTLRGQPYRVEHRNKVMAFECTKE